MSNNEKKRRLVELLSTGKSMLFTGAGFSIGATNSLKSSPPVARELIKKIKEKGEIEEDQVSLDVVVDFYLSENSPESLIELLKEEYTITAVSQEQKTIASIPWRRCYTTNYDEVFEMSAAHNGVVYNPVTLGQSLKENYSSGKLCVHLNGYIKNLNKSTLQKEFKLSETSYANGEFFNENQWFYYFQQDLEQSPCIVIIGYSLYDYEFRKLFRDDNDYLKNKIFFITSESVSDREIKYFEKYGTVLNIGTTGFAKLINEYSNEINSSTQNIHMNYLNQYSTMEYTQDIILEDSEIENFLVFGQLDDEKLIADYYSKYRQLCNRSLIEESIEALSNRNNILITSSLGNGKSIFLKQFQEVLAKKGTFNIYLPNDSLDASYHDYINDFDKIVGSNKKSVIILDNLSEHTEILKHYTNIQPSNIFIVTTSRQSYIKDYDSLDFYEVNLDYLDEREIQDFIRIVDNLSLWGKSAGKSEQAKIKELENKYQSQISYILLKIFESTHIQEKIHSSLSEFIANDEAKKTIFVISLLGFLDKPLRNSLITLLSKSNLINKVVFKNNDNLKQFFFFERDQIKKRSSLLCQSIIRNKLLYDSKYIVRNLLEIVELLDSSIKESVERDYFLEQLLKDLLKSSTIEKILPEGTDKLSNLKRYYDELKKVLPWLKEHSHYWVQYAMAHLTHSSLTDAKKYLDTAYSLAAANKDYRTDNIDTQQARYYLLVALKEVDSNIIFANFKNAHDLLLKIPNNSYRYRQVLIYLELYEKSYLRLSKKNKESFLMLSNEMMNELNKYMNAEENKGSSWMIRRCADELESMLKKEM